MGNIGTQAINPSLYKKMPYDAATAFVPITLVAELPLAMMVNPAVPAKTAREFIALAKSEPGKLSYSSSGAGGAPHLAAEMFKEATGTFIVHVPYRGGGPGHRRPARRTRAALVHDRARGQWPHQGRQAARARGHGIDSAFPRCPSVPTLAEAVLPGFNSISWIGLLAPAGTPQGDRRQDRRRCPRGGRAPTT